MLERRSSSSSARIAEAEDKDSGTAIEERVDKALERTFGAIGQKPTQRPVGLGAPAGNA